MNSRLLISALILAQTGIIKSSEKDILHEICKQREGEETRAAEQLAEITKRRAQIAYEQQQAEQAALASLEAEEQAAGKAAAKADDLSRRSVMTPEQLAACLAQCDVHNAKRTQAAAATAPATCVDSFGAAVDALSLYDSPTPNAGAVLATMKSLEDERSRRSTHETLITRRQHVLERLQRKNDDDVQAALEAGGSAYAVTVLHPTPQEFLAAITTEDKPSATTLSGIDAELTAGQAAFSQGNQTLAAALAAGSSLAAMEFKPAKTDSNHA